MSVEPRARTNPWRAGALGAAIGALGMYAFLRSTNGGKVDRPVAPRQDTNSVPRTGAPTRRSPPVPAFAAAVATAELSASVIDEDAEAPLPMAAATRLCAVAMEHIFAIELASERLNAEQQARAARAREQLDAACRERWSAQQIDCMQHADEPYTLRKCRPRERRTMIEMPTSVGLDHDVRCEVVGTHMADLMLADRDARVTSIDDLLGYVTFDDGERSSLPAEVIDDCRDDAWPDDL